MNEIYIYHHLGLGDHIILNGFVRHIAKSYDRTWVFAKPGKETDNVKRMYYDNKNIIINPFDDSGARKYMQIFPSHNYLIVGHTPDFFKRLSDPNNNKTFDQLFYEDHQIPYEYKWDGFYYERNLEREKEVYYDILDLNDDSEFIFLHENKERPINKEIPKDIQIIQPNNMNVGIFDYLYTIEKAKEVHVMNSSFMNLIDCIQLRQKGLFYHEYSRPDTNTVLKLPWRILK